VTVADWTQRPPLDHARAGLDGVTVDRRILAIGGFDPTLSVFDFVEARTVQGPGGWAPLAPLPTPRGNLAVAALNGVVYALGGLDGNDDGLDVVEKLEGKSWSRSRRLPEKRAFAGAAGINGRLYVAGGSTDSGTTGSMIAYDPAGGSWDVKAPMPTSRERLRLLRSDPYLYAIGGQSADGGPLPNVERYDPEADTWRTMAPLREARILPGVVAARRGNDRFLVVVAGVVGREGQRSLLRTTEIYRIATDRWHVIDTRLPRGAGSLICATEVDGEVLAIGGATDKGVTGGPLTPTAEVLALRLTNQDLADT
jgi:hypothetical protein